MRLVGTFLFSTCSNSISVENLCRRSIEVAGFGEGMTSRCLRTEQTDIPDSSDVDQTKFEIFLFESGFPRYLQSRANLEFKSLGLYLWY